MTLRLHVTCDHESKRVIWVKPTWEDVSSGVSVHRPSFCGRRRPADRPLLP